MVEDKRPLVRVVAGVVLNREGEYLLSSRPEGKPYAGYWEFAGGKIEPGESELDALKREFEEELGIEIHRARPWLTKIHAYEHALVHLRFLRVEADGWSGELQAKERQKWSWQKAGDFTVSPMLPANGPLLKALSVPDKLRGRLKKGLVGENAMGAYRVVPLADAGEDDGNILFTAREWLVRTENGRPGSVWVVIKHRQQWQEVRDADVAVWQVGNEQAAEEITQVLAEGVPIPLVVYAPADLLRRYGEIWLQAGAHTLVEGVETEQV
ncbi:NUDIX domain-containing protein [Neisseria weaveri]|uniref:NUDIX domain-containing protein n=1 Tax=Neisseria weaveri TaxID=28091 RepID=UPI001904BA45|nr:NUDIX domain-containing protein [Neisseria weaveri]